MKFNKRIVIPIIIIILIGISLAILSNRKTNHGIIKAKTSDLTIEEIINLLSYIPFSNINFNEYNTAYNGTKMSIEQTMPTVIYMIYTDKKFKRYTVDSIEDSNFKELLEENKSNAYYFINSDVNQYLIKRYNQKLTLLNSFSDKIKVTNLSDKYITFSFINITEYSLIVKALLSVVDAKVNSTNITITEKALFYMLKDNKYYVYKNTDFTNDGNIIKVYDKVDVNGNILENKDIDEKIKEDFKDYKGEFIHTFKKNNTGYYWYSTEFVE